MVLALGVWGGGESVTSLFCDRREVDVFLRALDCCTKLGTLCQGAIFFGLVTNGPAVEPESAWAAVACVHSRGVLLASPRNFC